MIYVFVEVFCGSVHGFLPTCLCKAFCGVSYLQHGKHLWRTHVCFASSSLPGEPWSNTRRPSLTTTVQSCLPWFVQERVLQTALSLTNLHDLKDPQRHSVVSFINKGKWCSTHSKDLWSINGTRKSRSVWASAPRRFSQVFCPATRLAQTSTQLPCFASSHPRFAPADPRLCSRADTSQWCGTIGRVRRREECVGEKGCMGCMVGEYRS